MSISKRLTAMIASGFALAATPEAEAWKKPRPPPDHPTAGVPLPSRLPEQADSATAEPPATAFTSNELAVFASGFALSAAAAVGIWMLAGSDSSPVPEKQRAAVVSPRPAAPALGQIATCPLERVAAAAGDKDGRFPLQASVEGLIAADITSFVVIGNQAAAAGRPRDAEAAFLMSCRVAEKLTGAQSVELADAKYHLGTLYSKLALDGGVIAEANRAELLRRAEFLYLDSLETTIAHYGEAHEKSRLAAQGFAAVRQTLAQRESAQPAPAPSTSPVPASVPVPPSDLVTATGGLQKPPEPARPVTAAAPPARPLPATDAPVKGRQDPSALKKCSEAVAALGLCNPSN